MPQGVWANFTFAMKDQTQRLWLNEFPSRRCRRSAARLIFQGDIIPSTHALGYGDAAAPRLEDVEKVENRSSGRSLHPNEIREFPGMRDNAAARAPATSPLAGS
jgi:hypothetical protein